ncbi:hypothetical protein K474DRAFT_311042 [Panus rudis PR-1116 ss-1]|nr:hypothetical protein K474DRAFT_311042 [Panus rudis PR-1116 ss-1]
MDMLRPRSTADPIDTEFLQRFPSPPPRYEVYADYPQSGAHASPRQLSNAPQSIDTVMTTYPVHSSPSRNPSQKPPLHVLTWRNQPEEPDPQTHYVLQRPPTRHQQGLDPDLLPTLHEASEEANSSFSSPVSVVSRNSATSTINPGIAQAVNTQGPTPTPSQLNQNLRTYPFRSTGFNTMSLLQSSDQAGIPDMGLYDIEISLNCFMPTSNITTIRRRGHFVAKFEMGISSEKSRIRFGDSTGDVPLDQMFSSYRLAVRSQLPDRWCWERDVIKLSWETETSALGFKACLKCYKTSDPLRRPLARFIPGGSRWQVSALLVERKRLSPNMGTKNDMLFN